MALLIRDCKWSVMDGRLYPFGDDIIGTCLLHGHFCNSQSLLHGVTLKCLIMICGSNLEI